MVDPTIILGPPGTGKTTELLSIMESELARGVSPDKIAFVSFTKKAVSEAVGRATNKFNLTPRDLPYFRTLHSLGYLLLGIGRDEVMQHKDYHHLGAALGLVFTHGKPEDGLPSSSKTGDRYSFLDSYSQAKCITPEDAWSEFADEELNWFEFQRYQEAVARYKASKGLYDFTDMLKTECDSGVEVAIIDEAQDLSMLQWRFIHKAFNSAKRVFVAGDDDQGIFEWSGAAVDYFIDMPGNRRVLTQSWRVPSKVHEFAQGITSQIKHRSPKKYLPQSKAGQLEWYRNYTDVDLVSGSWLLLARNSYLLSKLAEYARESGVPYSIHGESSINSKHIKAIKLWEHLRGGASIKLQDARLVYEHMNSGMGYARGGMRQLERQSSGDINMDMLERLCGLKTRTIWHEALTAIPVKDRLYYINLLRAKEKLSEKPRVNISTIHGVKGGEADHVLLMSDMSYKTHESMQIKPDCEHRVYYVGATRAKESLHVIETEGNFGYF